MKRSTAWWLIRIQANRKKYARHWEAESASIIRSFSSESAATLSAKSEPKIDGMFYSIAKSRTPESAMMIALKDFREQNLGG